MTFLRPWLLVLAFLPLFFVWGRAALGSAGSWKQACDPHLLPHLLRSFNPETRRRRWGFAALWILMTIALSGPAFLCPTASTAMAQKGMVIVLDLSPAMTDAALFQAKLKTYDLLKLNADTSFGLVLTDEKAYTALPVTRDHMLFENLLPTVQKNVMPSRGGHVERGVMLASNLLHQAGFSKGQIVVMTAGIADQKAFQKAVQKSSYGVKVLGFGQIESHPIRLPDGSFWSDTSGKSMIVSMPDGFISSSMSDDDLNHIQSDFIGLPATIHQYQDAGIYVLLFLLPFVLLLFRRGMFWMVLICLATSAQADPLRRAEQVHYETQLTGVAAYHAGDYPKALSAFAQGPDIESLYNKGNALAHLGRVNQAVEAYETVLALDPGHADAAYNLEYLKRQQQSSSGSGGGSSDEQEGAGEQQSARAQETPEESDQMLDGVVLSQGKQQQQEYLDRVENDPGHMLRYRLMKQYESQDGP